MYMGIRGVAPLSPDLDTINIRKLHVPGALLQEITPGPTEQEEARNPEPVWMGLEKRQLLHHAGVRTSSRSAPS